VPRLRLFSFALSAWLLAAAVPVRADARPGDPLAYDLRMSLSPVAFQAAVSQSWFGSAARIEYGVSSRLDIGLRGRIAWWSAIGEKGTRSYSLQLGFVYHFDQELEDETLAGTVYPGDTPALQGPGSSGTDQDLMDIPVSERMRGGDIAPKDYDRTAVAAMRKLQSIRFGIGYVQVVERLLPEGARGARNQLPLLHAGYGWGTHWNLPADVTGQREVGYRRFYIDALLTLESLTTSTPERTSTGAKADFFPLGLRIGMEGTLAGGLIAAAPGVGLGYDLEMGAYPGRGGLEGYLLLALGVALDFATH
jgi:hypothetical protein